MSLLNAGREVYALLEKAKIVLLHASWFLAKYGQLKNVTVVIPTNHELDCLSVGQIYSRFQATGSVSPEGFNFY